MPHNYTKDPQKHLIEAFNEKNLSDFIYALEFLDADPNKILDDIGLSLFQKCLITPKSGDFIRLCVENGADCYSKSIDGRFPIHFVIDSQCPNNVAAFLKNYDASKINIKLNQQNSLHLLIEKISSENYEQISECLKIFLQKGCSANLPNDKNQTPFFMLLEKSKSVEQVEELIEYFLKNAEIDIYTYKQEKMIESFRQLKKNLKKPAQKVQNIDPKFMMSLVINQKEAEFEAYYKAFKESCSDQTLTEECAKFLEMATIKNCPNIVELLLLDVPTLDINTVAKGVTWKYPVTFISCMKGYYKILAMYLKQSDLKFCFEKPKELPLEKNTATTLLHEVCLRFGAEKSDDQDVNFQECFNLLINDSRCDVNRVINSQDSYGCTPLHYTTRYKNEEATMALLKKSAYLCIPNNLGQLALNDINRETFERFLDECIVPVSRRIKKTHMYVFGYDEQEIHVDYSFLMPPVSSVNCEITPLRRITKNSELRKLIQHPTLFSFLYIKWSKISLLFNINFLMFAMFLLSFIFYIVLCQSIQPGERRKSQLYMFFYGISIVSVVMLTLREIFQCLFSVKHYFRSKMNWFEIALIILSYFVLFGQFDEDYQRILRGVTILFATTEFLMLAGTLPNLNISTSMVILRTVILTFLKSIALYSILLVGFALCFYTIFGHVNYASSNSTAVNSNDDEVPQSQNSFIHPGTAIIKTFVMLTGEFEFGNLELHDYTNYIIFVLFVFLVTIVLFNLLNALAVSDTQVIKAEGQLVDLVQRISVLNKYEKVISNGNSTLARFLEGTTNVFRQWIPTGRVCIFPNENNEIRTLRQPLKAVKDIGDEELQTLNNNNPSNVSTKKFEKIIVNEWLPQKLQSEARMDPKIMKMIKRVLAEKKEREKQNDEDQYRKTMDKKILRDIVSIKMQNNKNNLLTNEINRDVQKIKKNFII